MKKIDIYVNGVYVCSTTRSRTTKEAKQKFIQNPVYMGKDGITKVRDVSRVTATISDKEQP